MLLAGITTAGAATVVQTQNVTNLGNFGQSYSWNAFDTDLGTLTSAVFVVNGAYSGSFEVYAYETDTYVNYLDTYTTLDLQDQGQKGSSWDNLPFNGNFAPGGTSTTFTISGSPGITFDTGNLVPSLPSNYFTNTSFTSSLNRSVQAGLSEFSSTYDYWSTELNGTISLTYTYTPSAVEPVPEISTVTMGGAGGLLLLGIAARSRRRQQPSDSVPA
jgi:hypothetical protein